MHNQKLLNNYFADVWKPSTSGFGETGFNLANEVKDDEWVLDVGCGYNPYKNLIKNLVGIDPANDAADHKEQIEFFDTDQRFDVAFCLGSLNFGDKTVVEYQIGRIMRLMKPKSKIYWRCNPGNYDHNNQEQYQIQFYPWREVDHYLMAPQWGYRVEVCKRDSGSKNRIYAVWVRDS